MVTRPVNCSEALALSSHPTSNVTINFPLTHRTSPRVSSASSLLPNINPSSSSSTTTTTSTTDTTVDVVDTTKRPINFFRREEQFNNSSHQQCHSTNPGYSDSCFIQSPSNINKSTSSLLPASSQLPSSPPSPLQLSSQLPLPLAASCSSSSSPLRPPPPPTATSTATTGQRVSIAEEENEPLLHTSHPSSCQVNCHQNQSPRETNCPSDERTSLLEHTREIGDHQEHNIQLHLSSSSVPPQASSKPLELLPAKEGIFTSPSSSPPASSSSASSASSTTETSESPLHIDTDTTATPLHLHAPEPPPNVSPDDDDVAAEEEEDDDDDDANDALASSSLQSSSPSQTVSQANLWRTLLQIFRLLVVVLLISYLCLGSHVKHLTRSSKSSHLMNVESNPRQEREKLNPSNRSNLNVYSTQSPRDSLLNTNNNSSEVDGNYLLSMVKPDALVMMSNSTSNSQHINSLDIRSPEASILYPFHFSSSSSFPSPSSPSSLPYPSPSSFELPIASLEPNEPASLVSSERQEMSKGRSRSGKGRKRTHHPNHHPRRYHHGHHGQNGETSGQSNGQQVHHQQQEKQKHRHQLPHDLERVNVTIDESGSEFIAVENLVMTTLPNITDEDDLSTTSFQLNNRSLARASSTGVFMSQYPVTSLSRESSELTTEKDETTTTRIFSPFSSSLSTSPSPSSSSPPKSPQRGRHQGINSGEDDDDDNKHHNHHHHHHQLSHKISQSNTSGRVTSANAVTSSSRKGPSGPEAGSTSELLSPELPPRGDSIEFQVTRVPPSAFFFLSPCSGYAVALQDKRITATHQVPVETHNEIRTLSRLPLRLTRHLGPHQKVTAAHGKREGEKWPSSLSSSSSSPSSPSSMPSASPSSRGGGRKFHRIWYFEKQRKWMKHKVTKTSTILTNTTNTNTANNSHHSLTRKNGGHILPPLDLMSKRVSRSAQNPSQVSSVESTATSNFDPAVWMVQSYTYWVGRSRNFAVTIKSKSGVFLCFSKKGKLVTKATANGTNCMFKESIIGNYHSFGSILKPDWTIGFDCHGKPIHHQQVTSGSLFHQKSPKQKLCSGEVEHDEQFKNQGKCFQLLRVTVPPSLLKNNNNNSGNNKNNK